MCIRDRAAGKTIQEGRINELHIQPGASAELALPYDLTAVSYTHLDVYKRQGAHLAAGSQGKI